jgi:uncharacterized protein (TIGR02145 family)
MTIKENQIMKKILLCAAFIAASFAGSAQVGIGTTNPDASAALDITSTTKGLLTPRMKQAQRNEITTPATGLIVWCTNCGNSGELQVYNGTTWTNMIGGTASAVVLPTSQVSNGDGGFYTFLSHNLGADTSLDPHTPVVGLQGGYVQWGKPGPANWESAANDGANGFAAAPTAIAANDAAISGWSQTAAADGSWNANENSLVKVTANDPCPTGYRVPTRAEWEAVNTNNTVSRTGTFIIGNTEYGSALQYGTAGDPKRLTLPAAGNRNSTNGALNNNRGNSGFYWSSTENGSNAYYFFFGLGSVRPANYGSRTIGFSLRCIAE